MPPGAMSHHSVFQRGKPMGKRNTKGGRKSLEEFRKAYERYGGSFPELKPEADHEAYEKGAQPPPYVRTVDRHPS